MIYPWDRDSLWKHRVIPDTTLTVRVKGKVASATSMAESAAHYLVGRVMAYQGDDE